MPHLMYGASTDADVVTIPARKVIAIDGDALPASEPFQRAIAAIYGVAYTLKFTRKARGADFTISPLEARWTIAGARMTWQLRMAVPDDTTKAELKDAIRAATTKKGGKLEGSEDAARVALARIPAMRVGRALHIGAYATERETFELIEHALAHTRLAPAPSHLEIYLSDQRRTPSERLRTVLLRETTR